MWLSFCLVKWCHGQAAVVALVVGDSPRILISSACELEVAVGQEGAVLAFQETPAKENLVVVESLPYSASYCL